MMRMFILPALLLFGFFTGEGLILVNQANAACCMCGTCRSGCTCPGVGSCYRCNTPDPSLKQLSLTTEVHGPAFNVRGIQEFYSLMLSPSVEIAQAGHCSSGQTLYRLKLLDSQTSGNAPVVFDTVGQLGSDGDYRMENDK
jgi:hypothetical protein